MHFFTEISRCRCPRSKTSVQDSLVHNFCRENVIVIKFSIRNTSVATDQFSKFDYQTLNVALVTSVAK